MNKYAPIRFLANLLRCFWIFFPSLFFIVLALLCFTQLSQGKDLLISFTETQGNFGSLLLSKFIFLIAIVFWVYVSWYSSRMISYIKAFQRQPIADAMEYRFLHRFPRIIGYACMLVIILSLFTLSFPDSWLLKQPFLFLIGGVLILWQTDKQLIRLSGYAREGKVLRGLLWALTLIVPALLILFAVFRLYDSVGYLLLLVAVLLVAFMLYINLRRHRMDSLERQSKRVTQVTPTKGWKKWQRKWMIYLHLPTEEAGYFTAFNIICLIGLIVYALGIFFLKASSFMGPFPFILLAFAVLLGFGNVLTALSCKWGISIHFFIFVFAAFVPTPDHHRVRTSLLSERQQSPSIYQQRQTIQEYLSRWVAERPEIDSAEQYPMYIVLANGGASRSAYWVASVLGKLEDASIAAGAQRFSRQIFGLSGSSGGGVGIATFYSMLLHQQGKAPTTGFEMAARNYLRQDFLTFTLARMLGPDFFNYIPVINLLVPDEDRAEALEQAFEKATDKSYYYVGFDSTYFDQCITQRGISSSLPLLFINTTRVRDGNPGVLSSIKLQPDLFNRRVDVLSLLQRDQTIRLSTAAILGARFPFISPAGRIDSYRPPPDSNKTSTDTLRANYFVDGGYFDNSGAGVVQEMIRAILQTVNRMPQGLIKTRCSKLSIRVLHITNSPQGTVPLTPMGPFVNDLLSPLLTITGAFDMQTTVNDRRFITYIADVNQTARAQGISNATYIPIHLYNDPDIPTDQSSKGPYAMNWYISDSVRNQMDRRLKTQPRLIQIMSAYERHEPTPIR